MPRKIYSIDNLDCANCAAKIEAKFNALPQVEEAVITFATRQLRLTAEDPDGLIDELTQIARTVEAEVTIRPREAHDHHHDHAHGEDCGCGHHHDHDEGCGCGHQDHHHEDSYGCGHQHDHKEAEPAPDSMQILAGAGFFALGLLLQKMELGFPAIGAFLCGYLVLGLRILITAGKNLIKGHIFDENFLMSLATLGAFAIQEYPEAVGVMLFYRIGEYFEEKAVARSRSQIMEAVDLRPETVNLVSGDELRVIPAGQARVGDLVLVRPGDRVPLDGTVVSGESRMDTSPITGEPVPRGIRPGDSVVSGCVNLGSPITIRAEKELSESMVTRILESVENAAASKPKIDRFITRFARIYTPIVVALAVGTAIIPSLITGDWGYWVYTALSFLVMSCPCALVLSVPLAFFSGIGKAGKQGILFKGGVSIEVLADVKAAVLDKTGTITMGNFEVRQITGQDTLAICAACEQFSTHPIAVSILSAAKDQGLTLAQPEELEEIPGHGIRAVISGKTVLCGNAKLLEKHGVSLPSLPKTGETLVLLAVDGEFRGYLTISDTLKAGAKDAISRLRRQNIASAMLTGDREESARAVAAQVGIEEVYSRLLPEQKLEKLSAIREKYGPVLFVGDGINDAPVLSGADVGAAMGSGADAAIEAADVVFMTADVAAIPKAVEIARQTRKIAWQNVVFALAIKIIVMILGLCGFASMWMAVFADSGVAMLCVLNSIRVLYKK